MKNLRRILLLCSASIMTVFFSGNILAQDEDYLVVPELEPRPVCDSAKLLDLCDKEHYPILNNMFTKLHGPEARNWISICVNKFSNDSLVDSLVKVLGTVSYYTHSSLEDDDTRTQLSKWLKVLMDYLLDKNFTLDKTCDEHGFHKSRPDALGKKCFMKCLTGYAFPIDSYESKDPGLMGLDLVAQFNSFALEFDNFYKELLGKRTFHSGQIQTSPEGGKEPEILKKGEGAKNETTFILQKIGRIMASRTDMFEKNVSVNLGESKPSVIKLSRGLCSPWNPLGLCSEFPILSQIVQKLRGNEYQSWIGECVGFISDMDLRNQAITCLEGLSFYSVCDPKNLGLQGILNSFFGITGGLFRTICKSSPVTRGNASFVKRLTFYDLPFDLIPKDNDSGKYVGCGTMSRISEMSYEVLGFRYKLDPSIKMKVDVEKELLRRRDMCLKMLKVASERLATDIDTKDGTVIKFITRNSTHRSSPLRKSVQDASQSIDATTRPVTPALGSIRKAPVDSPK